MSQALPLSARITALKVGGYLTVKRRPYGSIRTIVWRINRRHPDRLYCCESHGRTVKVYREK